MTEGGGNGKMVVLGDISLVECNFAFLLFREGAGDCKVAMQVEGVVVRY